MAVLTDADRTRLGEIIEKDWVEAALAGDWDASMALCTDDFVYLPPDHPILNGKEEAKAFFAAFPAIVEFSQSLDEATGSTDLAVLRGSFDLTTVANATAALNTIDTAIDSVTSFRGGLGAVQNRLSSTFRSISATSENLAAAESRIRDVDVAKETSKLVRNQILLQASTSLLAQANLQPQIALSLIQG